MYNRPLSPICACKHTQRLRPHCATTLLREDGAREGLLPRGLRKDACSIGSLALEGSFPGQLPLGAPVALRTLSALATVRAKPAERPGSHVQVPVAAHTGRRGGAPQSTSGAPGTLGPAPRAAHAGHGRPGRGAPRTRPGAGTAEAARRRGESAQGLGARPSGARLESWGAPRALHASPVARLGAAPGGVSYLLPVAGQARCSGPPVPGAAILSRDL